MFIECSQPQSRAHSRRMKKQVRNSGLEVPEVSYSSIGKLTPHVLIFRFALAAYEFLYIQSIEKSAEKKISVGGRGLGSPQVPNMSKTGLESLVESCQFWSREVTCWHVGFMLDSPFLFVNVNFCGLGLARQHDFTPLYRRWRANWRPERFPCLSSVQIRMPSYLRAPQTSAIATPLRASFLAFAWTPLDAFGYLWIPLDTFGIWSLFFLVLNGLWHGWMCFK